MNRKLRKYTRVGVLMLIGLWLLYNLVGWGFCGSYAEVGPGVRLSGFLLWGGLLSLGPIFLAAPQVTSKGDMKWTASLSLPRFVPLLCWLGVLVWCVEIPVGAPCSVQSDAELLAVAAPLLLMLWLSLGVPVLALLVWGGESLVRVLFRLR